MAPALTETLQSQNFNLLTSPSRSSPSLSLKNFVKKSPPNSQTISNGFSPSGMNGHTPSHEITYNINGLVKNLKNEFVSLKDKAPNQEVEVSPAKISKTDADFSTLPHQVGGGYMMSSDPDMGLQKSTKEMCEGEKISPEEEQMLKNLSSVMNNSEELTPNPELTQGVEDIIKAISSLEGDIKSNEIESGPSGDIENIFDNGLFNEADIMNMCVDESLVAVSKDTMIKDRIEDIRKRQFQTSRKCDFLLRRLKKIQARTVGRHAAEEITGVIEYSTNLLDASRFHIVSNNDSTGGGEPPEIKCDIKTVSFSAMSHFMRQMEQAVGQQTSTSANRNKQSSSCTYFGSGSSSNSLVSTSNGVRSSLPGSVLPQYPISVRTDLQTTSGELKAQLVKIQTDIDSDVTESSSGGESCDEFLDYSNPYQHLLSIGKRAGWRWAEQRSQIAARWSWLHSQMADLEFKIRTHNETRKNIRIAKGSLKFVYEGQSLEPATNTIPPPNGPTGCSSNPEKSVSSSSGLPAAEEEEETRSCSRTRALLRSSFALRNLFALAGLHRVSKRAARATGLRCGCRSTLPGCGLCTGRSAPGQPSEPLATLPVCQRVGYIDPAFHPVLSLPHDVSASIHYNSVMKCPDWQSRASRIQGKSSIGHLKPHSSSADPEDSLQQELDLQHQLGLEESGGGLGPTNSLDGGGGPEILDLQRSKAAALAVSVKLRRKLVRGRKRRRSALDSYKHRRKHSGGLSGGDSEDTLDQDLEVSCSRYPSPVPSPATSASLAKDFSSLKRKRENSYDIDNIVIPYSMASATRLEKLNYKEILTPKWRHIQKESSDELELKNGILRRSSHEAVMEVDEDTSDEAHLARHERCQAEEKKKFLSYLKLPGGGGGMRGRAQRRTDSRADSSGPNTPDGMSPREEQTGGAPGGGGDEGGGTTGGGMTSPPHQQPPPAAAGLSVEQTAAPAPSSSSSGPSLPGGGGGSEPTSGGGGGGSGRKRTISSSLSSSAPPPPAPAQLAPPAASTSSAPPLLCPEVPPYSPREFPLSEELYREMLELNQDNQYPPATNSSFQELVEDELGVGGGEILGGAGVESGDSTDSADSLLEEDPNDPEWTVAAEDDSRSHHHHHIHHHHLSTPAKR